MTAANQSRQRALALLGPCVRQLREHRGMTQRELGAAAGYSEVSASVTISRIEKSQILPSLTALVDLADALGVEPHALLHPTYKVRGKRAAK